MNVLGLSAYFHDASAALVSEGRLVAAAAEERFTLQKHDPSFPKLAARYCLDHAGLSPGDLDAVVFYEEPHVKFTRVLSSALAPYPFSYPAFARAMKTWMGSKLWTSHEISRRLGVSPERVHLIPHHTSHAAQAFLSSPFEEAAVLVVDAVGEWASTSLYHARFGPELEIKLLETIPYPHSLGLVYAAFTGFLGFRVNDQECSTMALAAFGRPTYADKVREVIRLQRDGAYAVDPGYFTFDEFKASPLSRNFIQAFGEPRSFKEPLPFDSMARRPLLGSHPGQRHADLAASIQLVLEEALLGLCRRLYERAGSKNLCLAGGVATNCVANSRILKDSPFQNLFIPPDPGDGGAAAGSALYAYFQLGGNRAQFRMSPFLGKAYDPGPELAMLGHLDSGDWPSNNGKGKMSLEARTFARFADLAAEVVDELRQGRIVGWLQGRFENGPRALGNRSILVDPGNIEAARRLSRAKARAPFRPYALSVTEEDSGRILEIPSKIPQPARWMQMAIKVKTGVQGVAAGVHADATSRAQVLAQAENPRFHKLISLFGQATGSAALVNTSLNAKGFPIASSPAEALLVFARTEMDSLVLGDVLIRKAS